MIQDIAPHRFDTAWQNVKPDGDDYAFCFTGRDVWLTEDGGVPRYKDFPAPQDCVYLFSLDGARCFLLTTEGEVPGLARVSAHRLRKLRPMHWALAAYTAQHLYTWYRDNRFCGRCGTVLERSDSGRRLVCPACRNRLHPEIHPAVIVGVTDGDRLLMASPKGHPDFFALIAGFTEIGETAEQTVAREVFEETGLRVKNIRYAGSQPWGCAGNLSLGYWAELDGDDTPGTDTSELSEARWFTRKNVPLLDDELSLTADMVRRFKNDQV